MMSQHTRVRLREINSQKNILNSEKYILSKEINDELNRDIGKNLDLDISTKSSQGIVNIEIP